MNIDSDAVHIHATAEAGARQNGIEMARAYIRRQFYLCALGYIEDAPGQEQVILGEHARIVADEGDLEGIVGLESAQHAQMLVEPEGLAYLCDLGLTEADIMEYATTFMQEWLGEIRASVKVSNPEEPLGLIYGKVDDRHRALFFQLGTYKV